jgi:predicted permease
MSADQGPRIPGIQPAFHHPSQSVQREVEDEFDFHIEMRAGELIAEGWRPEAARAEAIRLFGDMDDARAYCRQLSERRERRIMRLELLDAVRHDLTFAARSLRRAPGFTLAAVITLALGIGANITMFGIVDRLLLRPPAHVSAPDLVRRLYFTQWSNAEESTDASIGYPAYVALAESMRPVAMVAAYTTMETIIGEPGEGRREEVVLATASYLPALGVRPALGRFFTPEEDAPPIGATVAVISHSLWTEAYGGDSAAVGRTVTLGGKRYRIIGVTPAGFTGADPQRIAAWIPVSAVGGEIVGQYVTAPWHEAKNIGWLRGIARVRSEAAIPEGERLATAGYRRFLETRWSATRVDSTRARATLEPLLLERGPDQTPSARIAVWLAAMSLLVVLIACANVANLLLARALGRRREIAVRMALGAGRTRLVSQLLTEGMLIALLGGGAALLVAHSGGRLVSDILLPGVEWGGAIFDGRMLAATAVAVIGTGLLIGLVPALQASDMNLAGSLKTGAREGGGRRSVTRASLVVVQAALSLVLLVGAGLFLRSLHKARSVDLGFVADRVLAVNLDMTGAGYSNDEAMALYEQLHARVDGLPGVEHASLAFTEPFATNITYDISIPGRDSIVLPPSGPPRVNAVTPEFFATMGTRLIAGRGFTSTDRRGAPMVGIISETMARLLWPGRSALGERVCISELQAKPCFEIIGVAQDARWQTLGEEPGMQMYFPLSQNPATIPLRVLHLRIAGDPAPVIRRVQDLVRQVAPRVLFADVEPLAENLEPEMRPWRVGATVFTLFGALALVLAGLGLYSVIAYDVAQRTREMAVRIALGARAADVLRLIVTQGVRLAGIGIVIGVMIALGAASWVGPLLFDTTPRDPLVLGVVGATLFTVAVAASLIPAWRATRVAPGAALRVE